jgi:hypothetical protein
LRCKSAGSWQQKQRKTGNGKDEDEDGVDGVTDFQIAGRHVARNITGICVHLRPIPPSKSPLPYNLALPRLSPPSLNPLRLFLGLKITLGW